MLEAAYDDSQGVTAEFNLNMLRVVNRELDADFDLEQFEHVAFYDEAREWIEMRLRARRAHSVRVAAIDLDLDFDRGEELRTEISAKFTPARVRTDLAAAGLELVEWLTDPDGAVRALAQPESTGSSAPSLTSVSASSAAGSESRTTPTPA